MIDSIKIYCGISKEIANCIDDKSIEKNAINKETGEILYKISNSHIEGSYSSSLSVRPDASSKYRLADFDSVCVIEGSLHKFLNGYNSHNGFYDLQEVCQKLIFIAENRYNVKLPHIENWYLQRCDIAICYDLHNQNNVMQYINNLGSCNYARRKSRYYANESLYFSGTTSTLKIYNKLLEFRKHDIKKFTDTDFDIFSYLNKIRGYIRFECEIKKKMLQKYFGDKKHINVIDVNYSDLKRIWSDEFMKLLKFVKNDLEIVRDREEVLIRLQDNFTNAKAINLYNFYILCSTEGLDNVKKKICRSSYFQRLADLKKLNIDVSQKYELTDRNNIIDFNPFLYEEVV